MQCKLLGYIVSKRVVRSSPRNLTEHPAGPESALVFELTAMGDDSCGCLPVRRSPRYPCEKPHDGMAAETTRAHRRYGTTGSVMNDAHLREWWTVFSAAIGRVSS